MPELPGTFRPAHLPTRVEVEAEAEARRGSARERGYSGAWDKAAAGYRRKHPLCLGCATLGRVAAAEVVDHVVPHKGDAARFWDRDNWQGACRWHHDVVKQRLEAMFARGEIGASDLRLDSAVAARIGSALGG